MGKYSSDSDSSDYSRKKKSRRNRSSSRSSSSSRYSSRSKKSKKSKKYHHSRSSERSSKYKRRSREGSSSSSRARKSKHGKHSRRRSRSSSHSKLSSTRSPPYSSRSHSKDTRSPSYSRSRRRSHSSSPSSNKLNDKKSLFDGAELLAKLNKAATEAMSENTKKLESLFADNQESRSIAIEEINAPNFIQKSFTSSKEDVPVLADVSNFVNFNNVKEEPGSLLHANLLIEDLNDKINRWVKKLYQIRQKSLFGEPLAVD